ncbi:YifB family Mg chelatase-like AAA ATPase [Acinetobacter sp. HY1485]|uniref:YifB family Mg chelatase-like AAA ATPase n=1 Tax=Acinetobacter sp. HY1485 TaxID=2970918 RepID=UPI0022B98C25|nr:YifB family Mg chelatase-like AAA ATPase [Acinetobacter sp. HY1485]
MSFAKVFTRSIWGLHAPLIEVEVHVSQGLPSLTIVGLPEIAVKESKDRVRSAILNSGFSFPTKRLTINLAPADLPKDGTRLDLPIAIGILVATKQIEPKGLEQYEFCGELALDGQLRSVNSVLTLGIECQQDQHQLIIPLCNTPEATQVPHLKVFGATNLKQVCEHLTQTKCLTQQVACSNQSKVYPQPDLADVKGQLRPKRALEIAAAGGHCILFRGPPGTGKTLLASRLPSILPCLTAQEALEVARIYSVANQPYIFGQRPFRDVHHTSSGVALVGGGTRPKPGEITLAHLGTLFLDELPEFDRKVLEVLRQPLESKKITISRAAHQVTFPANFQLIAAMNPCPCGYAFHQDNKCQCTPQAIRRYQNKISGPLLDRIDLHIDVPPLTASDLQSTVPLETSAQVKQRVEDAYQYQIARQGCTNQALSPQQLEQHAPLDTQTKNMLSLAQQRLDLSARAYHRILRVARTIADLEQSKNIQSHHLSEALSYRSSM